VIAPLDLEPPERVGWRRGDRPEPLLGCEWLLTSGLGGYALGTIAGVPTRRYHGLLVAALPAPLGRSMMLNHLVERLRFADGSEMSLGAFEPVDGGLGLAELATGLAEFRLVNGRPRWRFEGQGARLEKRLVIPHRQNSVHVIYRLLAADGPVTLVLEPALDVRSHDGPVAGGAAGYRIDDDGPGVALVPPDGRYPPLRLLVRGRGPVALTPAPRTLRLLYRVERHRGLRKVREVATILEVESV